MTKKEKFINFIQSEVFDNPINIYGEPWEEDWDDICSFWEDYKKCLAPPKDMTENGLKVLTWMQEHIEEMSNVFTAKEIGEGLFTSGRSISGSMKKLVNDGYVEKIGKNPVQYSLTESGKLYHIDN